MSNQVVLRPLRFTADVPAMRRFLETLGLKSRVESEHGGWVDMVAGRGMVALHDSASSATGAKSGETGLSFEADDIEELKERLQAVGYQDATVWDEAYGRVLSVTAPGDAVIWVDQRNDDLYGYKLHDAKPDERWSVTPTLQVSDRDAWQHFLETIGGDSAQLVSFGPPSAELVVRLGFNTTESLAEVEQRLAEAGYVPTMTGDGLAVEDPDGQVVTVKRA
jgi:catechol 2,3-dioxygenase-like lactoylglutathione lyase family enzyme